MKTRPAILSSPLVLLLSLVILSTLAGLRFNQSLWLDEGSSVWFARLPLRTLLTSLCDPHPSGYYLLLKIWLSIGESEVWLRVPSLLASGLAVALTFQLGKERCGAACAGLAALLLALQPLQSWYASEVRMYALAQALGVLLVWLGWRILDGAARWPIVLAYLGATLAAWWVDYTTLLPWGLLQLIWIARGVPRIRSWIALQVFVLLPLLIGLLTSRGFSALSQSYQPIFLAMQATALGLALTPATAALLMQAAIVLAGLISLALAGYWRRHTFLGSPLARSAVVGLWIALLLFSIAPRAFTLKRVLSVMLPYFALATAYVLIRWPQLARRSLIAIETVAAVISLFTLQREPWRAVIAELITTEPSAVVWVDDLAAPVFDYYQNRLGSTSWAPLVGRALPHTPTLEPAPGGALTILTGDSLYRRLAAFLPAEFYARHELSAEQHERGISVYHYRRRAQPDSIGAPPARSPGDEWGLLLPSPLDSCTP